VLAGSLPKVSSGQIGNRGRHVTRLDAFIRTHQHGELDDRSQARRIYRERRFQLWNAADREPEIMIA
jgi:hypothetical protein